MKDHLQTPCGDSPLSSEERTSESQIHHRTDFSIIFKELFSVAAANLADHLHQPLEHLGTLFEEPIATGRRSQDPTFFQLGVRISQNLVDLEKGSLPTFRSRGKFLFIVRHVDREVAAQCDAAGFRFASLSQVSGTLAQHIQMPKDELEARIVQMRSRSRRQKMSAGVHLAYFELRPRLRQGFDVLVPARTPHQLPTIKLSHAKLSPWQIQALAKMDNWTVDRVLESLKRRPAVGPNFEKEYYRELSRAMTLLVKRMDGESILQARLSARLLEAPCEPSRRGNSIERCTLITIHLMSSVYTPCPKSDFVFVPLRCFTVQQQVHTNVDHHNFEQKALREFAHCLSQAGRSRRSSRHSSSVALLSRPVSPELTNGGKNGAFTGQTRETSDGGANAEADVASQGTRAQQDDDSDAVGPQATEGRMSLDLARSSRTESETFVDHMLELSTPPMRNCNFGQP